MAATHAQEIAEGRRFAFGAHWAAFLERLTPERIAEAERSLREMLGRERLDGLAFLDVGSGSGLFSLAARRLGARVTSFDFDPKSVACTEELRRRYAPDEGQWAIFEGSALDDALIARLGTFDIVYSWGVLHHTGSMWKALGNVAGVVRPGGTLFIAIYNYQVYWTAFYTRIKRLYVALPRPLRFLVSGPYVVTQVVKGLVRDVLLLRNPVERYRERIRQRGMSMWHDWIDWIGGYPFEAVPPEAIFNFFRERGFSLERLVTCGGGQGCNEFVFIRTGPV